MPDSVSYINSFESISLKEMDKVALLNRTDTKYVFGEYELRSIFEQLKPYYRILEIENNRTNHYRTVYFDSKDLALYHAHQAGKLNRYKVRIRKYLDSDLCYLEVKFKNNKSRTIKSRSKKPDFEIDFQEESREFLRKKTPLNVDQLEPALWNTFSRYTLVHKTRKERLTIDTELKFELNGKEQALEHIAIAEVKQEKFSVNSDFIQVMKKMHIRPMRISKYCIGSATLGGEIKKNRFKEKILAIKKIQANAA